MHTPGILYVVATPIGHLGDISQRAIDTLRTVDLIAAEDTRHSGQLLTHLGIHTRMVALHEHNEATVSPGLIEQLRNGRNIALITDAGTPAISDPGAVLVRLAHRAEIRVAPIPGASAVVSAMSVAGISEPGWVFYGFLPARPSARRKALHELVNVPWTLVLYEAPHRIVESVTDLYHALGERELVLARELTKLFETVQRMPLSQAVDWLQADPQRKKGEFVLIVSAAPPIDNHQQDEQRLRDTLMILLDQLPVSQAAQLAAKLTGMKKNHCYQLALTLQNAQP